MSTPMERKHSASRILSDSKCHTLYLAPEPHSGVHVAEPTVRVDGSALWSSGMIGSAPRSTERRREEDDSQF